MQFAQICYGKLNDRWQSFNIGGNYTGDMIRFFERCASNNAPQNMELDDINSNQDLWEISSQDRYTEVSMVRYGLTDQLGRSAIFAHGFVFANDQKYLEQPSNLICISPNNFHFTYDATKEIPSILKQEEPWTVDKALQVAAINNATLMNMIAAVYLSLSSVSDYPTYFICNSDLEQVKALAYLIYCSLPYSLRYNISISNLNNFRYANYKCFMFVQKAPQGECYVNLDNNDTNINLDEVTENVKYYPFFNLLSTDSLQAFDAYCKELDNVVTELKFSYFCSYKNLLIVEKVLAYKRSKSDKTKWNPATCTNIEILNDVFDLTYKVPSGIDIVEEMLAELLTILFERYQSNGETPNERLMHIIEQHLGATQCEQLQCICEKLQVLMLLCSDEESVAIFLNEQKCNNPKGFTKWVSQILQFNGIAGVHRFYRCQIEDCYTFEEVEVLWNECKMFHINDALVPFVQQKLHKIALLRLVNEITVADSFEAILNTYCKVYETLFCSCTNETDIKNDLITDFWQVYEPENFQFKTEYISNLQTIITANSVTPSVIVNVIRLYDMIAFAKDKNTDIFRENLINELVILSKNNAISKELKHGITNHILQSFAAQQTDYLPFWYSVALFDAEDNLPYIAVKNLVDWQLDVFVNADSFEQCLKNSQQFGRDFAQRLLLAIKGDYHQSGYMENVDIKSSEYLLVKDRAAMLAKYLKTVKNSEQNNKNSYFKTLKNIFLRKR